jgi:hypothetical protein
VNTGRTDFAKEINQFIFFFFLSKLFWFWFSEAGSRTVNKVKQQGRTGSRKGRWSH